MEQLEELSEKRMEQIGRKVLMRSGRVTAGMESLGFIKETMNVFTRQKKVHGLKAMRRYLCRSII